MAEPVRTRMTVEEFLSWDPGDDVLYELIDGLPTPKYPANPEFRGHAAPSEPHGIITMNLGRALGDWLAKSGRPCHVMATVGQPVRRKRDRTRIPDVTVKCGPGPWQDRAPVLIVEIVSPSNTWRDMRDRVEDDRSIDTVQEILLIEQDRPEVEVHRRIGDLWPSWRVAGLDDRVTLESLGLALPLAEIYATVIAVGDDRSTDG